MPHLTADALDADPLGLAFLREVLAGPKSRRQDEPHTATPSHSDGPDLLQPVAHPEPTPAPISAVPLNS